MITNGTLTIFDILLQNKQAGKFWDVAAFKTRYTDVVYENDTHAFFVQSDKSPSGRVISVCEFDKVTKDIRYKFRGGFSTIAGALQIAEDCALYYGIDVDAVLTGFKASALFTANDNKGNPLDQKYTVDDFSREAVKKMREIVKMFLAENAKTLSECVKSDWHGEPYAMAHEQIGHDLLMTMQGQGVGFWEADHCTKEQGKILTDAAEQLVSKLGIEPYVYAYRKKLRYA